MTVESRLDRLYPALSARERTLLVLQAWKEDHDEDPQVRLTMPDRQGREFNRLIGLMNGVNRQFGLVLLVLVEQIRQVELKQDWLTTIVHVGEELERVSAYIMAETKEPISESALRARTEVCRAELLPLGEAAALMAEEHPWDDADLVEEDGERRPSDAAWDRVVALKRRALREAIGSGALAARGKGRRARIAAGDFYDWWGQPLDVMPDWSFEYEVYPDAEAETAARRARYRERARKVLRRVIPGGHWPVDVTEMPNAPDHEEFARGLAHGLVCSIAQHVCTYWGQLRAVELVTAEVAEEFGGEDPMRPLTRTMVDDAAARLRDLADGLRPYAGEVALPEPDDELLREMRRVVEWDDD